MNTIDLTMNTIDFSNLDELITNAPEEIPPTPEEIENKRIETAIKEKDARAWRALGPRTGWPEKYLEAVKTPPHGKEWLMAQESARERVRMNGIVVLYGKRGGGKTRMAAELAFMVGSSQYRTAMRFFLEVRSTFRKGSERSEMEVIDELAKADLLILDEIQERGETAFEDRLLTHVIDARYSAMKPTILIANLAKSDLAESLGKSIVDRARENGKSIEFNWPSYRQQ
jgi:SpoVK/Ycf46/Vps4 family AAA+-type ATPase